MFTGEAITLKGMRFHARVGVLPHEEVLPQPLELDLTVWVKGTLAPANVPPVDYRDLYALVETQVAAGPIGYLEQLCSRIADAALTLAPVTRVRVAARKPHVALGGPLDHAEVAVERARDA